ncbi:DUF7546 family protein [Natranaeroarchaeum sulfidigenes]|uniref:Putative membrane protein n=1 Tax=Natranaeroarchaeum sulfidigenes TaxID=2784880 RepID=A0A897MPW2_9EURY|nr:hypothetical protein [Natranaeroarchaeum sulfidigenes]QSG02008.1 putative membrane protein [Natranaeroarchaeum sulfidigenes]
MRLLTEQSDLDRFLPGRETALLYAVIINTQLIFVGMYLLMIGQTSVTTFHVYPLIWLNVGAWALYRTSPAEASVRTRRIARAVAGGYFVLLALLGGLVSPGASFYETAFAGGFNVNVVGPPGLVPNLYYGGELIELSLMPALLVGYAALTYLVYATIIDATNAAISGLLGLISCVSCTWPLIAAIVASLTGGSASAFTAATSGWSFGLSTAVFVVTVALLYWRPFGR